MTTAGGDRRSLDADRARRRSRPSRDIGAASSATSLLQVVAGLVLLYIFLPIFVIVLFSFNKPAGKFNYTWQGFTLDNWANPFKYPALTEALKMSLKSPRSPRLIARRARHTARDRPCAPTVPRAARRSTPSWFCR